MCVLSLLLMDLGGEVAGNQDSLGWACIVANLLLIIFVVYVQVGSTRTHGAVIGDVAPQLAASNGNSRKQPVPNATKRNSNFGMGKGGDASTHKTLDLSRLGSLEGGGDAVKTLPPPIVKEETEEGQADVGDAEESQSKQQTEEGAGEGEVPSQLKQPFPEQQSSIFSNSTTTNQGSSSARQSFDTSGAAEQLESNATQQLPMVSQQQSWRRGHSHPYDGSRTSAGSRQRPEQTSYRQYSSQASGALGPGLEQTSHRQYSSQASGALGPGLEQTSHRQYSNHASGLGTDSGEDSDE